MPKCWPTTNLPGDRRVEVWDVVGHNGLCLTRRQRLRRQYFFNSNKNQNQKIKPMKLNKERIEAYIQAGQLNAACLEFANAHKLPASEVGGFVAMLLSAQPEPVGDLDALAKRVHDAHINWWRDIKTGKPIQLNKGELLMLIITELAEAVEGIRKNLMDDKLPHRRMEEVEMADAKIRLLDFAGGFNIKLERITPDVIRYDRNGNKAQQLLEICRLISNADIQTRLCDSYLSYALSHIEAYCQRWGLDIDGAMAEKMAYNAKRADHKPANRRKANGKKF